MTDIKIVEYRWGEYSKDSTMSEKELDQLFVIDDAEDFLDIRDEDKDLIFLTDEKGQWIDTGIKHAYGVSSKDYNPF